MRIKKVAIIIFALTSFACLPFAYDLLIGSRIVDQLQTYYRNAVMHTTNHAMSSISYFALIILIGILLYPLIMDYRQKNIPFPPDGREHAFYVTGLKFKINVFKNFINSKIFIKRMK